MHELKLGQPLWRLIPRSRAAAYRKSRTSNSVVYVSYDGLLEPLGQSQVVAYMEKLSEQWSIHIISFEKPADRRDATRMSAMRARLVAAGIEWTPLTYHKSPSGPATAFDIAQGAIVASWLALRRKAAIIHVRSYVPTMMGLAAKRVSHAKLLFDMRGFWADERTDGNLWPKGGTLYRAAKRLESLFIAKADHIITLTHASAGEIEKWPAYREHRPPLSLIPTCADLERFQSKVGPAPEPFVFGYVGSVGTWYLLDEIISFFRALQRHRPNAIMLFVNRNEHDLIRTALQRHGIPPEYFEIVAAEHEHVPRQIGRMHAAAAFIKPSYSKMSSAPTKLAEYLGCGVPCVGNVGVGDMEEILEGRRVGVALRDFSPADHERAVNRLLVLLEEPEVRSRCVATAREMFSLERGVAAYREVYADLCKARIAGCERAAVSSDKSR